MNICACQLSIDDVGWVVLISESTPMSGRVGSGRVGSFMLRTELDQVKKMVPTSNRGPIKRHSVQFSSAQFGHL